MIFIISTYTLNIVLFLYLLKDDFYNFYVHTKHCLVSLPIEEMIFIISTYTLNIVLILYLLKDDIYNFYVHTKHCLVSLPIEG